MNKKIIFLGIPKVTEERSRIRNWIRTKMSRIPNTALYRTWRAGPVVAMLAGEAPDFLVDGAHVLLQRALAGQHLAAQRAAHLRDTCTHQYKHLGNKPSAPVLEGTDHRDRYYRVTADGEN
jgi:hypothetical protein